MGALLARESSENTRSALDNIPVELQLACLARVPYKDLREGVTCTCKSWRSLVASDAFRKMRAACGFSEWAVFASDMNETANCYFITASGAYLTAPRPPVSTWHAERLTGASGDVVAVLQPKLSIRVCESIDSLIKFFVTHRPPVADDCGFRTEYSGDLMDKSGNRDHDTAPLRCDPMTSATIWARFTWKSEHSLPHDVSLNFVRPTSN